MKEFLHKNNVSFVDRDVTEDEHALDDLEKLGVMTTPVTVIDGQNVIGFDLAKLSALLGL